MPSSKCVLPAVLLACLCLSLTACDNLSQEKYDRIKVGMSYEEVSKILGSKPTCDSALGMKSCTWGRDEKNVQVQFIADKVALHSAKGLR